VKVPGTFTHSLRVWDGEIPGTHEPGFEEPPIREIKVPPAVERMAIERGATRFFGATMGECRILLGHEPDEQGRLRWHLTISCESRHPSWDEIKTARYRFCGPDLTMAMILPIAERYINVPAQDHVFQLWELIAEEAEGW
jgi:hypothetical protein